MPTLILMRHSKSVDRMEAEDDFERGLTERGRSDAANSAAAMAQAGLSADHALVSPARRTRETYKHIATTLGEPPVEDPMALYHATTDMLARAVVKALDGGAKSIVLVGHNPGIGGLVHSLAEQTGKSADLPMGWPTSAVAAFSVSAPAGVLQAGQRLFMHNPKL
jgi:phosphohistidine phosphatase